ncbi:MAG TPA: ABC transporter substrate-binding protein [Polyangia bacterium]|nr:ABC transporter substrate-binding protein [Polyangia bacterium]
MNARAALALSLASFASLASYAPRAHAETRAAYGGQALGALASSAVDLDPLSLNPGDGEIAALLFDSPFRVDPLGRLRPQLALALDVDRATPLRARLRLRPDVRFHDGTPLRAKDVAASLARALQSPAGWMLAPIRAARAVADDVVEIDLARPAPDLALLLSTPAALVTPGGAHRSIGSGPFRLDAVDNGQVRLSAHAACFAGRPYLDGLTLRAYGSRPEEAGAWDVGALHVARHLGAGVDRAAVEGPMTITEYLAIGRGISDAFVAPFAAAFELGIDRDRLRRLAVRERAVPARSPAPPALGGASGVPVYDPAAATRAFADKVPAEARKVSLVVDKSRLEDRAVADRILADLARVGIEVAIDLADAASYQQRLQSGRYELLLGASAPPAPDGGLAELALVAVADPAIARAALLRAPAAIGAQAAPRVVPLYHRAPRLHHAAELRGLAVDGAGRASWADAHWRR